MTIKALLSNMTLKEKVGQLNQRLYGWHVYQKKNGEISLTDAFKEEVARWGSIGLIYGVFRADPWSGKNQATGLTKEEALTVSRMIQNYIKEHTRLGIPVFLSEECPHGHQGLDSTTTPANISSGASWNPELYQQVQELVAREIREKGAHLGLISTLDIARDPRWGRTEECFSEDPYLAAQFTLAALAGLQGGDTRAVDSNHVLAVLKHFAAQGSGMGGHNSGPVNIGERELREIHLPPMRAAVAAGAELCMAAYNDIDGIPCHGNARLLSSILREEFGFKGAVMADGCALDRLVELSGSPAATAAWALESGVDISLWDNVFPYLEEAVLQGLLSEKTLDRAVLRVLRLKEKMGLFEDAAPAVEPVSDMQKRTLVTKLAEESVVLIKNKHRQLPLADTAVESIAVIGPNSHLIYNQLGDYTPFKHVGRCVTVLQGLQARLAGTPVQIYHAPGTAVTTHLENGLEEALDAASKAEHLILVLGGSSARDFDTDFDANGAAISGSSEMTSGENIDLADIRLPNVQVELVKKLAQLGKKMTGILIQGRPHSLCEIEPYLDSLLIAGYPGEFGGDAIASIVFGDANPSGKLAMSIPRSSGQLPVYYNYRDIAFKKDYFDLAGEAAYPFGFGLSYTDFEMTNVSVKDPLPTRAQLQAGQKIVIQGEIANIGGRKGAEVIQLYVKSNQRNVITRVKELKGFVKVPLNAGETTCFKLTLGAPELREYDANMTETIMSEFTAIVETTNNRCELPLVIDGENSR